MKNQRQTNFEILRVIAMFMVVVQHYWLFAATGRSVETNSPATILNYVFFQNFLIFCRGGVPLFFLLSGFFQFDNQWDFKWRKVFLIWFNTLFYGALFCLLLAWTTPSLATDPKSLVKNILPLIGNKYWFITVYLALALLAPFLAKLSQELNRRQFTVLLVLMVLFGMTFWFDFPFGNALGVANGYTLIFAIFLFMTGAYVRKFDISFARRKPLLIFIGTLLCAFLFVFITETRASGRIYVKFPRYNDLCILVAIAFFIFVKDWKAKDNLLNRFLVKIAPYALGIYLIHENIYLREQLWTEVSTLFNTDFSSWTAIPVAILVSICVFAACLLVSVIIQWIMQITHLQGGLIKLSGVISKPFISILEKIIPDHPNGLNR